MSNNYAGQRQHPLQVPFTAATPAADVIKGIDLSGKFAIVTGASAGLGTETAKVLANAGADVTIIARDISKVHDFVEELTNAGKKIHAFPVDLIDRDAVAKFAEEYVAQGHALDILINNAGVMMTPKGGHDKDGNDHQFAINHLGHFVLTAKLWPALRLAQHPRVVNVSSGGHRRTPFRFDDYNFTQAEYQPAVAYGQAKTANVLFSVELDARAEALGLPLRAFSLHPGIIGTTQLTRSLEGDVKTMVHNLVYDADGNLKNDPERAFKDVYQGASTSIFAATYPPLQQLGGVYCENNNVSPLLESWDGNPSVIGVLPHAVDENDAKKLWALSEELTQVNFNLE